MVVANKRRFGVTVSSPRRLVRFINGEISIQKPLSSILPPLKPCGNELSCPAPQPKQPFTPIAASTPTIFASFPLRTLTHPPTASIKPFNSFADLFKQPSFPAKDKGILPLPPASDLLANQGWTEVVYKKKTSKSRSDIQAPIPPKPKLCFLCRDLNHMAKNCRLGAVRCFRCMKLGHNSRTCPSLPPPPSGCVLNHPYIHHPHLLLD